MSRILGAGLKLLLFLALGLVAAMRGATTDTQGYHDLFYSIDGIGTDPFAFYAEEGVEYIFGVLVLILKSLGLTHHFLFFSYTAASLIFLDRTIRNFKLDFTEVMIYYVGVFFLMHQLAFMRYGLAIALAFWFVSLRLDSNSIRSAIYLLRNSVFLSLFHVSAVAVPFSSWLYEVWISRSRKKVWILFLLILMSMVLCRLFVTYAGALNISSKMSIYAESEEWGVYQNLFSMENMKALVLFGFFYFSLFVYSKGRSRNTERLSALMFIYGASVFIRFVFYDFGVISSRLGYAFGFAEIFLIPVSISRFSLNLWLRYGLAIIYALAHRLFAQTSSIDSFIRDYLQPLN
jgi:hypothetical protein